MQRLGLLTGGVTLWRALDLGRGDVGGMEFDYPVPQDDLGRDGPHPSHLDPVAVGTGDRLDELFRAGI
jgi:hypothetical protein